MTPLNVVDYVSITKCPNGRPIEVVSMPSTLHGVWRSRLAICQVDDMPAPNAKQHSPTGSEDLSGFI
jgi:hypothetical protein